MSFELINKVNESVSRTLPARIIRGIKNFSRKREYKDLVKNTQVKLRHLFKKCRLPMMRGMNILQV